MLRRNGDERRDGGLARVRECLSQVRVGRVIALDENDAFKCTLCGPKSYAAVCSMTTARCLYSRRQNLHFLCIVESIHAADEFAYFRRQRQRAHGERNAQHGAWHTLDSSSHPAFRTADGTTIRNAAKYFLEWLVWRHRP